MVLHFVCREPKAIVQISRQAHSIALYSSSKSNRKYYKCPSTVKRLDLVKHSINTKLSQMQNTKTMTSEEKSRATYTEQVLKICLSTINNSCETELMKLHIHRKEDKAQDNINPNMCKVVKEK